MAGVGFHNRPAVIFTTKPRKQLAVNEEFDVKDAGRNGYKNKRREKDSRQNAQGENNRKARVFLNKLVEKRENRRLRHFSQDEE